MSLVGNLEDLGLGEILQIVSLSRKSGILELNSRDRSGRVIFRDGQVIRATATTFPENLGDLLLRAGMVDIDTLKRALIVQQEQSDGRRIGDILADQFDIDREAIDTVVRQQIERIVYSFFGWTEGAFAFELGEPEDLAAITLNPLQFMLDSGLNPQWLAMEGSRLVDEKRHRGEDLDERGESRVDVEQLLAEVRGAGVAEALPDAAAGPESAAPMAENASRLYLVVDDDPLTAELIAKHFQSCQLAVRAFTGSEDFLAAIADADPASTTLLIDLSLPGRNGSGILGGLELLAEVHEQHPDFTLAVMSDLPPGEAALHLRRFPGVIPLSKPAPVEIAAAGGGAALAGLVATLTGAAELAAPPATRDRRLFNIGVELFRELGEASGLTPQQTRQSPGLHLLRGMLQELNNPSLGGGIILLILRFASELMNRAVIFLVKEREIVGLGQFGIELDAESADTKVRSTRIPTGEQSLFSEALLNMAPAKGAPAPQPWNDYLFDQFGGGRPAEVFIGPLVSEGRVVAVLYGDNLPEQKPIGDTEALEIFLSQAGLAMEKVLLERRLMGSRTTG
jgi:CheY-like chemotaxis protein